MHLELLENVISVILRKFQSRFTLQVRTRTSLAGFSLQSGLETKNFAKASKRIIT